MAISLRLVVHGRPAEKKVRKQDKATSSGDRSSHGDVISCLQRNSDFDGRLRANSMTNECSCDSLLSKVGFQSADLNFANLGQFD